ncbi:2074_t:CDS:2, partial [Funneliformis geosporum]
KVTEIRSVASICLVETLKTVKEVWSRVKKFSLKLSIMDKKKLPPIHPGEILREELLIPRNISPSELATALKEFSGIKNSREVRRRLRITSEAKDKRDFAMFSGFRLEPIAGTKNHWSIRTGRISNNLYCDSCYRKELGLKDTDEIVKTVEEPSVYKKDETGKKVKTEEKMTTYS